MRSVSCDQFRTISFLGIEIERVGGRIDLERMRKLYPLEESSVDILFRICRKCSMWSVSWRANEDNKQVPKPKSVPPQNAIQHYSFAELYNFLPIPL